MIMRLVIELGVVSFGGSWDAEYSTLHPSALAPILITVLIGPGPVILAALIISVLLR